MELLFNAVAGRDISTMRDVDSYMVADKYLSRFRVGTYFDLQLQKEKPLTVRNTRMVKNIINKHPDARLAYDHEFVLGGQGELGITVLIPNVIFL